MGYGRARLWLGITGVGSFVTLSAVALAVDAPGNLADWAAAASLSDATVLIAFVLLYAVLHLPLDLLGGYLLPRRFGRQAPPPGRYAAGLARAVLVHSATLLACGAAITLGGSLAGVAGTAGAAAAMALVLLSLRLILASLLAPLRFSRPNASDLASPDGRPVLLADSPDEGFTGGMLGVFRPTAHVLPSHWRHVLGPDGLRLAARRRSLAIAGGGWMRGRATALLFTVAGVALSAMLVHPDQLGTAVGTIELSLWFTLWSFLGLLVLPTLSRRGVAEVDDQIRQSAEDARQLDRNVRLLDALQDDEPERPGVVETIFHPVPSVESRSRAPGDRPRRGGWDAARTAVFLSASGVGLLGRAVHCNCGRPALWAMLPTD